MRKRNPKNTLPVGLVILDERTQHFTSGTFRKGETVRNRIGDQDGEFCG